MPVKNKVSAEEFSIPDVCSVAENIDEMIPLVDFEMIPPINQTADIYVYDYLVVKKAKSVLNSDYLPHSKMREFAGNCIVSG